MKPETLSRQLREGSGRSLARRRGIVGLSLVSVNAMGLIALYQTGIIEHLPEPPLAGLDADKVDASAEAYAYFSTPDAVIGLGSYCRHHGTCGDGRSGSRDQTALDPARARSQSVLRCGPGRQAHGRSVDQAPRMLLLAPPRRRRDICYGAARHSGGACCPT